MAIARIAILSYYSLLLFKRNIQRQGDKKPRFMPENEQQYSMNVSFSGMMSWSAICNRVFSDRTNIVGPFTSSDFYKNSNQLIVDLESCRDCSYSRSGDLVL